MPRFFPIAALERRLSQAAKLANSVAGDTVALEILRLNTAGKLSSFQASPVTDPAAEVLTLIIAPVPSGKFLPADPDYEVLPTRELTHAKLPGRVFLVPAIELIDAPAPPADYQLRLIADNTKRPAIEPPVDDNLTARERGLIQSANEFLEPGQRKSDATEDADDDPIPRGIEDDDEDGGAFKVKLENKRYKPRTPKRDINTWRADLSKVQKLTTD